MTIYKQEKSIIVPKNEITTIHFWIFKKGIFIECQVVSYENDHYYAIACNINNIEDDFVVYIHSYDYTSVLFEVEDNQEILCIGLTKKICQEYTKNSIKSSILLLQKKIDELKNNLISLRKDLKELNLLLKFCLKGKE